MTVRAKFTFDGYESGLSQKPDTKSDGSRDWNNVTIVEKRTLKFSPVFPNNDPVHENNRFWDASPSGRLELGCINPEAWSQFELGREYYIDFTLAD